MDSPEGSAARGSDAGKQQDKGSRRVSSSCKQCRARKVKCDRTHPRCRACNRLQLHCSFSRDSSSPEPETTNSTELTQAGTKRKRARHACRACRVVKARCSGQYPCERCVTRGWPCEDLAGPGDSNSTHQPPRGPSLESGGLSLLEDAVSAGNTTTPGTVTSTMGTGPDVALSKVTIRGYVDAYFETDNRSVVAVLHKPTTLAEWNGGRLDPVLLKAIVATGRYRTEPHEQGQAVARLWVQEIQKEVLSHLARNSVTQLQIMVLLVRFRFTAADYAEAWNLLPLAARLAFTMRLNHEQEALDPVAQETRRRLVWAIYHLDRQFCGGIDDLAVCPPERMHIRLPCDEQSFQRGGQSRASFLADDGPQDGIGMDIYAYQLRLFAIRERVLSYTKRVRRTGVDPSATYPEMQALQAELDRFEQRLPAEFKLNPERLMLMAHSTESVKYIGVHMHWMQCHCDLYRFCVPGLRESVSRDALASASSDFVEYCQRACLNMALRLCDFWSEIFRLEPSEALADGFLAISIYQVAQICRHLQDLLPAEGEHCVERLREKLTDAVKLANPLKEILVGSRKCLKDAEQVIGSLGCETSIGMSSRASSVADDAVREHQQSRHGLLRQMSRSQQATRGSVGESSQLDLYPRMPTTEPGDDAARAMLDLANAGQAAVEAVDELVPWDPFDMQMNDYYNPEFGELLASMTAAPEYSVKFQ